MAIIPPIEPRIPRWLPQVADDDSTKAIRPRVQPYAGTADHDLPICWADLLMLNSTSGHLVR